MGSFDSKLIRLIIVCVSDQFSSLSDSWSTGSIMCMNMLSCCLNPACEVSLVCFISRILTVPVQRVGSPKKLQNESSEDECGFYLTFQQTVVMSNNITAWAQQLSLFLSTLGACNFISAYRETVASASWQQDGWCDARPPLLGRIQTGFCSVRERRPRQIDRGSACSANSWHVPREAALFFGSCRRIGKLFY